MERRWRESLTVLVAVVLLAALAGCGSTGGKILDKIGLEPPRSTQDRILYGYSQVEFLAGTTARLVQEKKVSIETAKKVSQSLKIAQAGLNSAADAYFLKDGAGVEEHLKRFKVLLDEINNILGSDTTAAKPKPATKPKPTSHWGAPVTG